MADDEQRAVPETAPDGPVVGERLTESEVARLNAALKALPADIAESLRSAPIGVREVRPRWMKVLVVVGVLAAIASGVWGLVATLTQESLVEEVAPISRTAERVDRGITSVESAIARVREAGRAIGQEVPVVGPDGRPTDAREIRIGDLITITIDRSGTTQDTTRDVGEDFVRGWRERLGDGSTTTP